MVHQVIKENRPFSGNIIVIYSFDVGDDINLERIRESSLLVQKPLALSKYFKHYHIPVAIELPNPHSSPNCVSAKLHSFGVITLRYVIPFSATLEELRTQINTIDEHYSNQSITDANSIFQIIKNEVQQAKFFHLRKSYVVIQVDPRSADIDVVTLKERYGNTIASLLRFETEILSDYQKNEILDAAAGYYQGDLIIIDTDAAFVFDDEYAEKLDIFEFATIQQLELHYFDRMLDKQLNVVYERRMRSIRMRPYFSLFSGSMNDPIWDLGQLQVDISVITDRLENSIKLSREPYYAELYSILVEKLDIKRWRESLHNKLSIIQNISAMHHAYMEGKRDVFLSITVIVLIFIELLVALIKK